MNALFWKSRRVLITGHTGFKGSWLSLWLQTLGAHVYGFSLAPNAEQNLFSIAQVSENMQSTFGDIRDFDLIDQAVQDIQPEIIFHLAAQPLVRRSYTNPIETYSTNVMGTVHILEAAKKCNSVKAIVNVTTDKCYENKEWLWGYRENDRLGGNDPYSNSKACSELVTQAYRNSFFNLTDVSVSTARAGNVIGGGDFADDRLIPDLIRNTISGEKTQIRYPDAVRPWQHVLESLSGYLLLAEKSHEFPGKYNHAWNFGPNLQDGIQVKCIIEKFNQNWGSDFTEINFEVNGSELHEANLLRLDSTKSASNLNWKPLLDIDSRIAWTAKWYQAWLENKDMKQYTVAQINAYQNLLCETLPKESGVQYVGA